MMWTFLIVLSWFLVNYKTINIPGFYYNAHLLYLLRLDVSSLPDIQYLSIEKWKGKTYQQNYELLNFFIFRYSSDEQSVFAGL